MLKKIEQLFPLLILVFVIPAEAQKLPTVQTGSIWAPTNIKIDGKADEWNNEFQAYNKTTELYYTIANDNDNLYLIARAINPRVIEKIINSGITVIINNADKQDIKDPGNVSVSYPTSMRRYAQGILVNAGTKARWSGLPSTQRGFTETLTRTDSSVMKANAAIVSYATNIKVKGVKDIPDSILSVYNEQRVRVAALFDIKGVYTYELAIPLKYLGISGTQRFSYNILLKGFSTGSTYRLRDPNTGRPVDPDFDADPDLEVTTQFLGEYTLAKKP